MNNQFRSILTLFFILLISASVMGQEDSLYTVKGKVFAGSNQPLTNVSVSVEGLNAAPVLTNENGEFELQVSSGEAWLLINPVGDYKGKRIFLNNRDNIVVSLPEENMKSGYDEVPVGNLTELRRDIIGANATLDINQMNHKNSVTVDQTFQGNIPGLFVTNHSGMPGKGAVSFLRGIQSMNASNSPLFIVNGMPIEELGLFKSSIEGNYYNPLTNIDPFDVNSVTVLKDPTLTSIYGSKASNGVIMIETFQPQSTETTIDIGLQTGMNLSVDFIPQMNSEQYKSLASEILNTSPLNEEEFEDRYPGLFLDPTADNFYKYMHNTNWQRYVFSDAVMNNVYFSVKGGSEIARYGLSVGYHNQGGIFENTNYNRFNVLFVSRLNVFPKFNMDVNASLTNSNSSLKESAISTETSPVYTSLAKPPILNPYEFDDDGQQLAHIDETDELGTSNPYAVAENFKGENDNYRLIASVKGEADLMSSLKLLTMFGLNFNTMEEHVFKPNIGMVDYFDGEARNVSQATNNYLFSFYTNNYLQYSKRFSSAHDLDASLGFRVLTNSFQEDFGETKNLPENDEFTRLSSGQNNLRWIEGTHVKWNWLSLYNQISYKFKDKYLLSTGISADFSTRTGKDASTAFKVLDMPFGLFYSVGAGWRISEEGPLKSIHGLDNLMLRLSYGTTGNDDIGEYSALNYYEVTRYRETSGLIPGALPNRSLVYEKLKQMNAGLDLSLWGSRTNLTVNYFRSVTEDLLIYEPQKVYMGYRYKPENAGSMENTGWEFSVYQRLLDLGNFKWDISSNLTLVSNNVLKTEADQLVTPFEGGQFVTREGEPVNTFFGYQYNGVFATYEEAQEASLVNNKGIPFGAGDARYLDVSGPDNVPDSVINGFDRVNLGSPMPELFGGLSNVFMYKRWTLDVMLQFVYGNEVFNYTRYLNERMVDLANQSIHVLDRWQHEGQQTDVPRALYQDEIGNSAFSSRWIEDGSYFRVKNVTISYAIPDNFLVFKNALFYVTGTNLFTKDEYLGYDPEFSYSYNAMRQGIDYGLMPQYRQVLLGIKFGL